jgi:PD-(D/E)XK nuclease superfamily
VPLLRIPFVKYWFALLDLVTSDRSREALARVMSSAYFTPRLSPDIDVDRNLIRLGYIDRYHLPASALAARKNSPLTIELQRFEALLDELERSPDTLGGFLQRLRPAVPLAERDGQAWRVLTEELDSMGIVSAAQYTFEEFRKTALEIAVLRTVDRSLAVTTAPGLPRVRIMSPHALGSRGYRWIFAPGFADGEFPGRSSGNPLLTEEVVESINVRIRPRRLMSARDRSRRDPLYLFMILDSASRRVTLTYSNSTLEGEPMYPSVYVQEIIRHFEVSPIMPVPSVVAKSEGEWRVRLAQEWRKGTLTEATARRLLGDEILERTMLESKGALRAQLGRGALPLDNVWNPSELNALEACPFVFLARHRLKLRALEIPDFEVPALEIGILAHEILRDFYSGFLPASVEEARAIMDSIIARRLAPADVNGQGPYSVFDPSLWKIRRRQLVGVLNRYVEFAVRDAADGFETQPAYLDSPLPPAPIGAVMLAGKPDHVAVHRDGGEIDALRIDDFKYSAASSSTAKQLKQSFQIPVYAYLAARALGADPGVRIEGRYLLLRSPGNPVVSHAVDQTVFDDVRIRIEELLEKVAHGRLSPEPADRQACGDCDYRRLCRLYGS